MDTTKAQELIAKFHEGRLTSEEEAILDGWYLSLSEEERSNISDEELRRRKTVILSRLDERNDTGKVVRLWPKVSIIAAAVTAIAICIYFFAAPRHAGEARQSELASGAQDIAPGKNGATITLANGKVIELSDAKSGVIVGGEEGLVYDDRTPVISNDPRHLDDRKDLSNSKDQRSLGALEMTASTARGQTYQFTLPDGTKVWLNADSKITFPSQFSGKERKILLSGEAYFEVAKMYASSRPRGATGDLSQAPNQHPSSRQSAATRDLLRIPFLVESKGQTVEVLGTHFNVNAYADEIATTTTLLEGSVRILAFNTATGRETRILKPNQQSILNSNGVQVLNADVDMVVGWKNGLFTYKNTPLNTVMRQISRWYNVDIEYQGDEKSLKQQLLTGGVSRYDNVSGILKAIEMTGTVKFKIKGKTITVYQE